MRDLSKWTARPRPDGSSIEGRYVRLERIDPARHGKDLGDELSAPGTAGLYDYLFEMPPQSPAEVIAWIEKVARLEDPFFYAVIDKATGRAVGRMSLMRIDPTHGVIEVGSILYGPKLQRTRGATECITLLAAHVFDTLGYRRFEFGWGHGESTCVRSALGTAGFRSEPRTARRWRRRALRA